MSFQMISVSSCSFKNLHRIINFTKFHLSFLNFPPNNFIILIDYHHLQIRIGKKNLNKFKIDLTSNWIRVFWQRCLGTWSVTWTVSLWYNRSESIWTKELWISTRLCIISKAAKWPLKDFAIFSSNQSPLLPFKCFSLVLAFLALFRQCPTFDSL